MKKKKKSKLSPIISVYRINLFLAAVCLFLEVHRFDLITNKSLSTIQILLICDFIQWENKAFEFESVKILERRKVGIKIQKQGDDYVVNCTCFIC